MHSGTSLQHGLLWHDNAYSITITCTGLYKLDYQLTKDTPSLTGNLWNAVSELLEKNYYTIKSEWLSLTSFLEQWTVYYKEVWLYIQKGKSKLHSYLCEENTLWLEVDGHAVLLVVQEVFETEELDGTHLTDVMPEDGNLQLSRLKQTSWL